MVRKASKRVVRSKPTQLQSSALPSVDAQLPLGLTNAEKIQGLQWQLNTCIGNARMFAKQAETFYFALGDAIHFYDRAAGTSAEVRGRSEGGWTAADVRRLEEIRKLVAL